MLKLLALVLAVTPALAEPATPMPPPVQSLSPSEIAIELDTAINLLARQLEQAQRENAQLRLQLIEAKKPPPAPEHP